MRRMPPFADLRPNDGVPALLPQVWSDHDDIVSARRAPVHTDRTAALNDSPNDQDQGYTRKSTAERGPQRVTLSNSVAILHAKTGP